MRTNSTDLADVTTVAEIHRLNESRRALTEEFRQLRADYDRVMSMRGIAQPRRPA